jgi:hypothetical protein
VSDPLCHTHTTNLTITNTRRHTMDSDASLAGHDPRQFPPRPIHHIGFHVPDLRVAIDWWQAAYGVGPFDMTEHVSYDECTSSGTPAAWDHSAAFCQWGAIRVELQRSMPSFTPSRPGRATGTVATVAQRSGRHRGHAG